MIIHQARSGKELCRHIGETIDIDDNSIASVPDSFHMIEDDDDMILSNSIVNLNIK
jgi:hypothetical protein